jgi:Leu/Phe-tRNA-protein transferase
LEQALREPPGLLAAGGDLSPARLLAAYERGVFPWYSAQQPILWWSPDPRMVLFPGEFRCSRSLSKTLRNRSFTTRIDHAFSATIRGCARPRRSGPDTWLNAEMIDSYEQLHQLGYGHCVETYRDERLVGGLYGIQLGQIFFGESHRRWRWRVWWRSVARATSRSLTARWPASTWQVWVPATYRAASLSHCYASTQSARRAAVGCLNRSKLH